MSSPSTVVSGNPSRSGQRAAPARGFTIIELVITMAVAGVLAAMAMPSLRDLVRSQRIKTASSDVYASLVYARSEAITRGQNVAVCATTNWTACAGTANWATGWIVFVDAAGTGAVATTADILKKQDAFTGITLTGTGTNLSYRRDGRLAAAVTDFVVSATGAGVTPHCISIGLSGQPNTKKC